MNKFMDFQEVESPAFKDIDRALEDLIFRSYGALGDIYYRYRFKKNRVSYISENRQWEYPWAILNSHLKKDMRVLDAGCGGSLLLAYLYYQKCICYGIDNTFFIDAINTIPVRLRCRIAMALSRIYPFYYLIYPHSNEWLSNIHRVLRIPIHYIAADSSYMPFCDNAFDRIFCISVIEHLSREQMLKTAQEFHRILRPGGLVIMTVDCWGTGLGWQDFIQESGLRIFGESDFTLPQNNRRDFNVVGVVLQK